MINISDKYYNLFNPPKGVDIFVLTGGRFSQKSFACSLAMVLWAVNYNHRILFSRFTNVAAKDSIIPEIEEKIGMLNYSSYFDVQQGRIESKFNNSKIVFRGMKAGSGNQTANLKGVKDFSVWVLDEAEELTDYDIAERTMLSIRGNTKGSDYPNCKIFIMNPANKEHWIYKHYFEYKGVMEGFNGVKGNICYIHTSYLDCLEFVPDDIIHAFEGMRKNNPERYNHIVMGGWLNAAEGVILTNWVEGEFDESLPYCFGQDFGFYPDPSTLIKVAVNEKVKKIYVHECFNETNLSTDQIFNRNKSFAGLKDLIVADSAESRLISELSTKGLNIIKCMKGKDSVKAGLKDLQDYQLVVTPSSINIKKELNNYVWNDKKAGIPIDMYNHTIDPIRYAKQKLSTKRKAKMRVYG